MDEIAYQTCNELLDRWEGEHLVAYKCPAGVWTISKGATFYLDGSPVCEGDQITQEQSTELSRELIVRFCNRILPGISNDAWRSGARLGALTSLAYNIGVSAFKQSTVLRRINANESDEQIREAWSWFKKAGGKTMRGLVNRRAHECECAGL